MTKRQEAILQALENGHTTIRAIGTAAGISSTSVVKSNLEALASAGLIVLERTTVGERAYTGREFCAAWDASARLAGNPEA